MSPAQASALLVLARSEVAPMTAAATTARKGERMVLSFGAKPLAAPNAMRGWFVPDVRGTQKRPARWEFPTAGRSRFVAGDQTAGGRPLSRSGWRRAEGPRAFTAAASKTGRKRSGVVAT